MLRAVLFDLDGVITDTAEYHYHAWTELATRLGIPFDRSLNERLKGVSRAESLEIILESAGAQGRFSPAEKVVLTEQKNQLYKELIGGLTPRDILPGIADFLSELKAGGIKTAVASASRNVFFILEKLELGGAFDFVVDPASVWRMKPAPDVFLAAAAGVGTPPGECVGIEDAAAGIEALRRAGIRSVGVGSFESMRGADLVLSGTAPLTLAKVLGLFR
ncbi:MAG: beta-phosphoglucomutase [Oscillospiraceae bacterium]|nr:beta-phosphoglucomutase [Oscillospiraceae bacterium]